MEFNYTPHYLDGVDVATLTARKKLAHVRKVLDSISDLKRYWPPAKWEDLISDLECQKAEFSDEVRRSTEALSGEYLKDPRFVFVNISNGLTVKCVVYAPDDKVDMPYIDKESYMWMTRVLRGKNIEVYADCDVYVVSHKTRIEDIIHRFE